MKNRAWMMLICCLGPLFLIFLAPALGLKNTNLFLIFIVAMFLCCFMMMGKGGGCCGSHKNEDKEKKEEDHGCH